MVSGAMDIEGLPGGDLVREGLRDLAAGRDSVAVLLAAVGAPRPRRAGLPVPAIPIDNVELRLEGRRPTTTRRQDPKNGRLGFQTTCTY